MADSSLDPEDRARLSRLEQGLTNLEGDLSRRLAALRQGIATDQQRVAREAVSRGAHEEAVARGAAAPRVILPSAAEETRFAQTQIRAGEAVDRRAEAFRRIQNFTLQTSREEFNLLSRQQQMLAIEREVGLARARNLQLIQRQAQNLGYALPGQAARGRGLATQPGPFDFRPPAPALLLPTGQEYTDQQRAMDRLARTLDSIRAGTTGRSLIPPGFGFGGGGRIPPPPRPTGTPEPPEGDDDRSRILRETIKAGRYVDLARAAEDAANTDDELTRAMEKSGRAVDQMNARVAESTRTLAMNSNQMRAHGALTTEFIQAAAKGQTTFRELGFQAGATIAKFGGWTAAAAAVYGMLGAVQNLGQGAVESLQGVNLLQRVVNNLDTDKAQKDFRGLANEFNLPMSQVTQTAYEASKAFKDQADSTKATRAALFAVKVGELDAASAGRFVTATARGFKLEASDLGKVIDTVNALQNRFGGNFGQIAQGMAAASGAFGAARGHYQELASAIATVQQTTGITGTNAATALRRTSELAFRPERRRGILDVLGVDTRDASTSITTILDAAMAKVSEGRNPLEIAKLITTPELASRAIAPLLASQQLYQQRLAVAEHPGDSSKRELDRARRSIRDQISMVGNQLEQIGSNLAQSGALNAFAGMLRLTNTTLHTVNELLEVFNSLPKPVREAAMYFVQIAGALAVMRRLDVGATVGQRFPFIGEQLARRGGPRARQQILQGLDDERKWLQEQGQAVGRQRALAEYQSVRAAQRHDANVDLHAAGRISDDDLKRSAARRDRYIAQAHDLAEDQADILARQNANLEQERNIRERTNFRMRKNVRTAKEVEEAALDEGVLMRNATLDRNVPERAVPLGEGRTRVVDADPEREARRAARAAAAEAERRPPIDWRQASGRMDVGAYHAALRREYQEANARAREAMRAREQFDIAGGGDPAERERLVREQQRARADAEAAFHRAEQARTSGALPGPRSQAIGDLNEWARDNATGEPIALPPMQAASQEIEEETKRLDQFARRHNVLRDNIKSMTQKAERFGGEGSRMSRILGTAGGTLLTAGKGIGNVGTGLAAFGRNLKDAIDPLTGIIAAGLIIESSYSYIKNKVQETNRAVADLRNVGTDSPEQIRRGAQRELDKRSPFEAVQDAFASSASFLSHLPGGYGRTFRSPNQARDDAARQAKRFAGEIEKGNRVGLYLTRGQITERLNENLRQAGDNQGAIRRAFAQANKEAQTARGLFYGSGDDGAPTGDELARAAKNIDNFRKGMRARLAGLSAINNSIDEALKDALDPDAVGAVLSAQETNIGLSGFSPTFATNLGKIRARAIQNLSQLDRGDPNYDANRAKYLQTIQETSDFAQKQATDRIARSAPYADPSVMAQIRERQIDHMRRTLIAPTARTIDETRARMIRRGREIARLHDELAGPPPPDPTGGATAFGAGGLGQMPGGAVKSEDEKARKYKLLKEAQKNDAQALEQLRKSLKMSKDEFRDFVREQQLAQYQAEQAAFDANTELLQSRTADTSQQAALALRRANESLAKARRQRARHLIPQSEVGKAETRRNQAAQNVAQDALKDAQAQDELATARAQAGGLGDRSLLQRQLHDAQRNAARTLAAVKAGKVDPDAYRDALKAVYDAQIALNDFVKQNGDSLLNALEQLALSKTEDPIKQATIRVNYARRRLEEAQKSGNREQIITAQADLNNRVRDRRNTIQQRKFDNIEFDAQMEIIGKQTEISKLQMLLQAMHGNEELRRQIRLRIHELKKSTNDLSSDDLTLGNIRLPTPYEVNRAIKEGGRVAAGGHQFNTRTNVNVYVARSEDAPAVGRVIDQALNTHVASVLRTRTR